jgi:hypothetical protein
MDIVAALVTLAIIGILYFIPSIMARGKSNISSVLGMNIFLGWTFLGWVIALAMGVSGKVER